MLERERKPAPNVGGEGEDLAGLAFLVLGDELDRIAFGQLEAKYPDLAEGIECAVVRGVTPADVRRFALRRGMPPEWVDWLENAARAVELE